MSFSYIMSTPSNSSFIVPSPKEEVEILDQVSRLTLEEPSYPLSPAFQTPQIRKRKPFSVVTPPRGHVMETREDFFQERVIDNVQVKMNDRGLPPLLPDSPFLDVSSDQNPFGRHRPIHSPFLGGSNLNTAFLLTLQSSSSNNRMPRLARRQQRALHFDTTFPILDEEDAYRESDVVSGRALKMRRRNDNDYPIFEGNL